MLQDPSCWVEYVVNYLVNLKKKDRTLIFKEHEQKLSTHINTGHENDIVTCMVILLQPNSSNIGCQIHVHPCAIICLPGCVRFFHGLTLQKKLNDLGLQPQAK